MDISRLAKPALAYCGHLLIAVIGPATLQAVVLPLLPHLVSPNRELLRDLLVDAVIALAIGTLAYFVKKSRTAYWIWIIPVTVLALRTLIRALNGTFGSVLDSHPRSLLDLLGIDVERGNFRDGLLSYSLFILPAVRTVMYSIGAFVTARFRSTLQARDAKSVGAEAR